MANARAVVYWGPSCLYCPRAKRWLCERGVAFEEIDVEADPEQRATMIQGSGRRAAPQILIEGMPVGGHDELAA